MKNKKTLTIVISFIVLCLTLGTLIVYDNFKIDITEYNLENDNLPESFNELKIIHLSDLHNTEFGKDNEKLLRMITEGVSEENKPTYISFLDKNNGTIDIKSEKGKGTEVVIRIPTKR